MQELSMSEKELTIEEKYELAKMVLMLIERASLAHMLKMLPHDELSLIKSHRMIANMAHVANHVNGEHTFDCGPKRDEHHATAIADYKNMFDSMMSDIADGNDVTDFVGGAPGVRTAGVGATPAPEIDDELAQPIDLT
jgi:predicted Zn-dependent protease